MFNTVLKEVQPHVLMEAGTIRFPNYFYQTIFPLAATFLLTGKMQIKTNNQFKKK
jgi:hypothetical protein